MPQTGWLKTIYVFFLIVLEDRSMKPRCHWQSLGFNLWFGKIPWRRDGKLLQVLPPGESHGRGDPKVQFMRAKGSQDTTERSNTFTFKPMSHTESFTLQYLSYHYFSHFSPNTNVAFHTIYISMYL